MMEIVLIRVISWLFGVVLLVTIVIVLYPASSSAAYAAGANECFERVTVGKRINASDVSRSVKNTTLKHCDVECEREMCNAYAYGTSPNGNGTCDISVQLPKSPPIEDPHFDLFIRVLQCRNMIMCFRRLVTGRRIIDRYVRRTFPCDSLARCQLACSLEREFFCEGFNYRFGTSSEVSNSCQLTAIPSINLDLTLDFSSDVDYDFYTRDRNAPVSCGNLSYRTWNLGSNRRTYVGNDNDWWQQPTAAVPPTISNGLVVPLDQAGSLQLPVMPPAPVDYDEISRKKWNRHNHECFTRARTGYRLHRQVVVMTLNAPSLYDCEHVCANERKFMCNILSYRYSSVPTTDNCMLGEKTVRQLDIHFDLVPDRDYDVYVRNEFSKPGCQPKRTWDSDCFERIRTGIRLDSSMIRFSVNTDSLIDCELICLHVRHFTCRAFSFRYGGSSGEYNCLLTDYPVPEMDPRRHFIEDSYCELYHRGSYGHGCEFDRWPYSANPASYPNFTPINRKDWSQPKPQPNPTPSPPIMPTVFTVTTTVYAYNPYGPGQRPTTAVTPYNPGHPIYTPSVGKPYLPPEPPSSHRPRFRPQRPILPASPTVPPTERPPSWSGGRGHPSWSGGGGHPSWSGGGGHPSWSGGGGHPSWSGGGGHPSWSGGGGHGMTYHSRKLDRICYVAYGTPARLKAAAVATSAVVVNEYECKAECSRARESSKFRCATISYWSGHCELSDIELRDLKPEYDFTRDDSYWLFSWDFTNPKCYTPFVTPPTDGVWSTYTVSGRRCKWGTHCSHRSDAGIWSCPVDDGDWDYCCRPDHHCGYSEGYNYPWCYVGSASRQQWRPCSDFYYPYQTHNRNAPHWPISYVHRQGPPNNTAHSQRQPSLVDSFFEQLRFDQSRLPANANASSNSSLPDFQVVDVTENIRTNLTDSSSPWNWSRSKNDNVTSLSNHASAVKIIQPRENEKVKRSSEGESVPNIT